MMSPAYEPSVPGMRPVRPGTGWSVTAAQAQPVTRGVRRVGRFECGARPGGIPQQARAGVVGGPVVIGGRAEQADTADEGAGADSARDEGPAEMSAAGGG